jgi:uncharacterized membrane protein YjjP (DUF1212 family)
MDDAPRTQRWLLTATAFVLALLVLYYYTGSWMMVVLLFAAAMAFIAYQSARDRRAPAPVCLRCGERWNANARHCDSCRSASWTTRG